MSKNKKHNEIGRTLLTILLAVAILAVIVTAVVLLSDNGQGTKDAGPAPTQTVENELPTIDVTGESEENTTNTDKPAQQIEIPFDIPNFTLLQEAEVGDLGDGLELLGVGRYTGEYFEDGTDEEVEDVYAIVVRNNGEDWVDFAVITMRCGGKTLTFELSALPGSTSALVLEADRLSWSAGDACSNPHAVLTEDATERRFDFDDDFKLYPSDGVINLQNTSGRQFDNDILVYYKNFDYGLFLGGITYRARFAGLAPEEIGQSIQPHYSDARSMILYLSYGD